MTPEKELEIKISNSRRLWEFFKSYSWRILILIILLVPALFIQNHYLHGVRKTPQIYRDSLYLPSGKSIKAVSIGYDRFMADLIWLRAIQAFGGHWETDQNYEPIFHLFDVITDLDPHFIEAYTFGNLVMGDEGGDQRSGLELIDKGMVKNPDNYKLPYWAGYVAYWQLDDPLTAKYYYQNALECSDVPGFVKRIVAYMDLKSGRYRVAFEKFLRDWLEAVDNNDDVVAGISERRIPDILSEWRIFIIRRAVNNYVNKTGEAPKNIHDLEKERAIEPYDLLVFPRLKNLVEYFKEQPGKAIDHFQDIIDGATVKDVTVLPPHPSGYWYDIDNDLEPWNEEYIVDGEKQMKLVENHLKKIRRGVKNYYMKHGRFPRRKIDIFGHPIPAKEPFGGEWIYIPVGGVVYSSTVPFM